MFIGLSREGRIRNVFGKKVLRIVFGTERKEVIGEGEEVGGVGKEGRAGRTERRKQNRNVCEILVRDLNGRDILEDLGLDGRMLI